MPDVITPTSSLEQEGRGLARPPLFVVLLGLVASFVRFGYAFGDGDHDEMLPPAIHLLHSELMTRDWLVQYITDGINVRTFFVGLLASGGIVTPLWLSTTILHVLFWCATAYGVYALAFALTRSQISAALGMLVALVVTPRMTLGSNAIVYNTFVPEGVAWAIVLPAFALFLKKRWILAGVLLGIAAWFQLLAGGVTAFVLGLICIWRTGEKAEGYNLRAILQFGLAFTAAALPILIPVVSSQISSEAVGEDPSTFFIFAVFRNPFHYLFFSFEPARHVRFWPLLIAGWGSLWLLHRRGIVRHSAEIVRFWIIALALWALSILFVDVFPIDLVAKLQFFKLTVLSGLLASLFISAIIVPWLPERIKLLGQMMLRRKRMNLAIVAALAVLVLILAIQDVGRPGDMLYPVRHMETSLAEVEQWAREETLADALFATPPSVSSFRSLARRSIVADWSAFAFDEGAMRTWYARLLAIAPIEHAAQDVDPKPELDEAFHSNTAADWDRLVSEFGIDYIVVESGRSDLAFRVAFSNEVWTVHDVRPEGSDE